MKAAVATGFGEIEACIEIRDNWPTPKIPKRNKADDPDYLLIRVLACALAPGDVRVLSGKTDYMQLPASGHPYVVGSDTSGIVVAMSSSDSDGDSASVQKQPSSNKFKVGDYVVARFDGIQPNGGVAEYRVVEACFAAKCPVSIAPTVACSLPASAAAAKRIVKQYLRAGDSVLVIGGSGGVGSSILQYCKLNRASVVVAVSTQSEQCKRLGADRVIDYREQKWWEIQDFHKKDGADNRFDVVFDLVSGDNWEKGARSGAAIKRSGWYVSLIPGVETEVQVHGPLDMVKFCATFLSRHVQSRLYPWLPKWAAPEALALEDGDLEELLKDVEAGRLQPLLDPSSPFEFTQEGVRSALRLQKSRHAHGKVIVSITDM